jgi:hypothetical protein
MRIKLKIYTFVFVCLTSFAFTGALFSQEKHDKKHSDFLIVVENTEEGITLAGINGTAWTKLSFTSKKYQPKMIDEYGSTSLANMNKEKHRNLANFLFTIEKTENGISLVGMDGTSWKTLGFSLAKNARQAFDQNGMTIVD